MRRDAAVAALAAAAFLFASSCRDEPRQLMLERATISVGARKISVELARAPHERARGLMFRRSLGEDEGMLFVYDSPMVLSFWMKNTMIPLSVAFIDDDGAIIQIENMRPYDTVTRHRSRMPVRYALEMNRGWFERNGVKVGDRVELPNDNGPGGNDK